MRAWQIVRMQRQASYRSRDHSMQAGHDQRPWSTPSQHDRLTRMSADDAIGANSPGIPLWSPTRNRQFSWGSARTLTSAPAAG